MKRIYLYIIITALTLLVKPEGTDVGKLLPVELVVIREELGEVVIETDTGNKGTGNTVDEAVQNLRDTTAGVVFLDTADFLLVEPKSEDLLEPISVNLKPSVKVCKVGVGVDLEKAANYLAVHPPKTTLSDVEKGNKLQELTVQKENLILK